MKPVIDLSKEYGLALEGGGARGAYQIGAWKALKEAGVKINAVGGTSVWGAEWRPDLYGGFRSGRANLERDDVFCRYGSR